MSAVRGGGQEDALRALVEASLEEDVGPGDWTTLWTIGAGSTCTAGILAKEPVIVAGSEVAATVFRHLDPSVNVDIIASDGSLLDPGEKAIRLDGSVRTLLTGERVALNFLGHLSGIATLTRRFVDAVDGTRARIVDTRKTTPGLRRLEKAAVLAGGGGNHRFGLHDMVLVKDNHIDAAGGIAGAVQRIRQANVSELPVEVEVRTLTELDEVLSLAVDRVLLDNMPLDMLAEAVRVARAHDPTIELEASGNVTLSTVGAVAQCGVDLISVGALTHSARSADFSMRIDS